MKEKIAEKDAEIQKMGSRMEEMASEFGDMLQVGVVLLPFLLPLNHYSLV